jgi:NADP-dependent 3-hydroxy acid dehydrogenase YdfG/predicted MFS family arabinose efflux permease
VNTVDAASLATPSSPAAPPLAAALLIGSVALLILGVQPIVLGDLVERHLITLPGVGMVAMGEIVALGLGVALGDALLPVAWQRRAAVCAALAAALLNLATVRAVGDGAFVALRAAAGLAEGVLVWVATVSIVRAAKPDRTTAVFMVMQTLSQIVLAASLSLLVLPRAGWKGGFAAMAALALLVVPLSRWLRAPVHPASKLESATATAKLRWSAATLLPLAVAFLQMAAIGALWAYLEPLGLRAGLDAHAVQTQTSLTLALQVAGGLAAIWWVRRLGTAATLVVGGLLLAAVAVVIHRLSLGNPQAFALSYLVFGFVWMFLMPFHVGLAFRADGQGRVAVLVPAAQLIGSACGPLLASLLLRGDDPAPVPLVSLGFALAATLLAVWAWRSQRRSAPMPAESHAGKVVLIAGASSGMGRALALRLAEEGATLVLTARRAERLQALAQQIEAAGGRCLALAADAEDADAAQAVVEACLARFGRIDLAVLNVGGAPALPLQRMQARDVTAYMRSNYDTVVHYLFPVLRQMTAQQDGVVVHTNSLAGFLGVPLQGPYSAAKGALRLLFDTCRIEFGGHGIRFVSLYPGFVATAATVGDGMPAPLQISEDAAVEHMLRAIRQRRGDYRFPASTSALVRLAQLLPRALTDWIQRRELQRAG